MQNNGLKLCVSGMFALLALMLGALAASLASLPEEAAGTTAASAIWAAALLGVAALPIWRLLYGFIRKEQKKYVRAELKSASLLHEMQAAAAEAQAAEKASRLYRHIALAVADKETLPDAVALCLKEICLYADWPVGQAFICDAEGGARRLEGAEYCRNPSDYAAFFRAGKEARYLPGAGAVGRAIRDGKPKWSPEAPFDEPESRKDAAQTCGLKGVFVFPVARAGKTELALEFYLPTSRRPDKHLLQAIQRTGAYISLFLQRRALELALQNERIYAERVAKSRADVMNGAATDLLFRLNAMDASAEKLCRAAIGGLFDDDIQSLRRHIARSASMLRDISCAFGQGARDAAPSRATFSPHALGKSLIAAIRAERPDMRFSFNANSLAQDIYQGDGERIEKMAQRGVARMIKNAETGARLTLSIAAEGGSLALVASVPASKDAYRALEKGFWGTDIDFAVCRAAAVTLGGDMDVEYDAAATEARLWLKLPMPSCNRREAAQQAPALSQNAQEIVFTRPRPPLENPETNPQEWRYVAKPSEINVAAS